jgi:hypothetical protein
MKTDFFQHFKGCLNQIKCAAYNMGFSAMLAQEYILIVPFAYHLQFGLNE